MPRRVRLIWTICFFVTALVLVVSACEHEPISRALPPDNPNEVDSSICFERDILPIFKLNCATANCHDANTHEEDYILDSYDNIMQRGIVKFNAEASKLYEVIKKNEMPQYPISYLTDAQKELIRRWINEGAPNGTNCPTRCDTAVFTFSGAVKPIMDKYCTGCHNSTLPQGGIILTTFDGVQSATQSGKLVSSLRRTTNWMPQGGDKLSECEITQINKWIDAGAKNN